MGGALVRFVAAAIRAYANLASSFAFKAFRSTLIHPYFGSSKTGISEPQLLLNYRPLPRFRAIGLIVLDRSTNHRVL